jgi:hypothetical protein
MGSDVELTLSSNVLEDVDGIFDPPVIGAYVPAVDEKE